MREILERTAATHRRLVATVAGGANVATAATAASAATAADTATAADACKVSHVVATGGGTRSELWLQIKADALGIPVVTTTCPERACLGAAMFAAVAAGLHPDLETAARVMVHENRAYFPARQKPENPFRA
ncbi:MAG: hypothetical protein LBM04_09595 [Opitutaceae bacterium]|nr:hypothetical protein [Opitutaceae bacterium]